MCCTTVHDVSMTGCPCVARQSMGGVYRFLQAADIPGQNNFAAPSRDMKTEEVSCVTTFSFPSLNRLLGLVLKASTSRPDDPGFGSRLRREFSWSSHTSDFKTGTLLAIFLGAWR